MKLSLKTVLIIFVISISHAVQAELVVEITSGVVNPTPIAIAPMRWNGSGTLPEDIATVIENDLRRSGQFAPMRRDLMYTFPHSEAEVAYRYWRIVNMEYLVIGNISPTPEGKYRLDFELYDIFRQRKFWPQGKAVEGELSQLRDLAHYASDQIYEALTGIRGIFRTKIAYVEQVGDIFYLKVSDVDGARVRTLVQSQPEEPILSPDWSPDGKRITYVSYATTRPAIYIYDLTTNRIQQITNFQGLNGAPVFSPDGQKLAFTLSKDGNPDIYVLDLNTRQMRRVVDHFEIDTEPNWTADGGGLIFTSKRGGNPQIYQITLANGRIERLTFDGSQNTGAVVSQDGKSFVYVYRDDNADFYIAHQDIASGTMRLLTRTRRGDIVLDESPTIAPNGAMLMYATKFRGKGILAAVSMDTAIQYNLPSTEGDVREPAWSPFLN